MRTACLYFFFPSSLALSLLILLLVFGPHHSLYCCLFLLVKFWSTFWITYVYVSLGKRTCLETKSLHFLTGAGEKVDSYIGVWDVFICVFWKVFLKNWVVYVSVVMSVISLGWGGVMTYIRFVGYLVQSFNCVLRVSQSIDFLLYLKYRLNLNLFAG